MAPPLQRIHPRLTAPSLSFLKRPASALGLWDQVAAGWAGINGRYGGPDAGTAQQTATPSLASVPNDGTAYSLCIVQVLSDPLKKQTIAAGPWRVAFAARLTNAGATVRWQGRAALHVVHGITGRRHATIFETSNIGSGNRAGVGELTCLDVVTGAAALVQGGDYLSLELGIAVTNTSAGAVVPAATIFADGVTHISTDGAAITSALSVLEAPDGLPLSLPTTGEQPESLSHAQVVQLLKDAFPPNSHLVYAWDESDAWCKGILDFLGDVYRVYGYNQVDRIFREVSPLTCIELLPAWEALLGISLSRAALRGRTVEQRRRVVLARLRERGPLSLHNLAAIFAALADYGPGTRPEVLELDRTDIEVFYTPWAETLPAPAAVPDGTSFTSTNLIRDTRALLDGGLVSDAGVVLSLTLSSTDTEGLRIQLMGPDFSVATWGFEDYPLPSLVSTLKLRAGAGRSSSHVGRASQGAWRLFVYKVPGSPGVNLLNWSLLVQGRGHGGRSQGKFHWAVYLDSTHQTADRRDIESTLDRITQAYARGFAIYSKRARPGELINGIGVHRAGRFLAGA